MKEKDKVPAKLSDVKNHLIQAVKELLPKYHYVESKQFQDDMDKAHDFKGRGKTYQIRKDYRADGKQIYVKWNEVLTDKFYTTKGGLKESLDAWIIPPNAYYSDDMKLMDNNCFSVALYERKEKGWENRFSYAIWFFYDKTKEAKIAPTEEMKVLQAENKKLKGFLESHLASYESYHKELKKLLKE